MFEHLISWALRRYYLAFDHPFKERIWKELHQILGNPRIIFPYAGRRRIALDLRDLVDRMIIHGGYYEKEVYDSLMAYVLPGDVLWDIGAHIGSFSVLADDNPLISAVYCFEPSSTTFAALTKNNRLNGNRLILNCFGLGSTEGSLKSFQRYSTNTGGNTLVPSAGVEGEEVAVSTIDVQVFQHGLEAPQLIKIDVEGMELDVFRGGVETIRRFRPRAIVFEARSHLDGKLENKELENLLIDLEYEVTHIPRPSGTFDEVENFRAVHRDFSKCFLAK